MPQEKTLLRIAEILKRLNFGCSYAEMDALVEEANGLLKEYGLCLGEEQEYSYWHIYEDWREQS